MKMLYVLIAFLICSPSLALCDCTTESSAEYVDDQLEIKTDVPKFLEGATITVKTKDGRESTVPAEKFKVVPRAQQFITTKTSRTTVVTCEAERLKHRVSILGGNGPRDGLDRREDPSETVVESRVGAVGGLQYQYTTDLKLFDLPVSIGGQVQTNKSGLLGAGVDF